jgi:flagellar biosynthesis/type III secretory pathway protein FliH
MRTGTSSLMDGKDYQQRKVMRIDDINAMADADIRENERLEKLAEEVYGKGVNQDYEEGYVDGYNKAKENLYTKEQLMEVIELARLIDYNGSNDYYMSEDEIIKALKP